MIFVCFCWQLKTKLTCSCEAFCETSIMNIKYFSDLQVNFVKNGVFNIGAVAASKAREKNTPLTIRPFNRVEKIFGFSRIYLYFCVSTAVNIS